MGLFTSTYCKHGYPPRCTCSYCKEERKKQEARLAELSAYDRDFVPRTKWEEMALASGKWSPRLGNCKSWRVPGEKSDCCCPACLEVAAMDPR